MKGCFPGRRLGKHSDNHRNNKKISLLNNVMSPKHKMMRTMMGY